MIEDMALGGLLIIALVFAVILILISTATVGRKLADLEYQTEAGVDGVRKIQAWINVRTHLNRTFLGVVFVVITILLLADAPTMVRTWTNRVLFAVLMLSYAIASFMDWRAERKQLQILQAEARDDQRRAFAAGAKSAESKAEADALARVAVEPAVPGETTPVDVATIAPQAAQAIAEAVRPVVVKDTLNAIADALPEQPRRGT